VDKSAELLQKIPRAVFYVLIFSVFAPCYIYCMAAYGFLWGVGLGWLPSGIVTAVIWWLLSQLLCRFIIWYDPTVRASIKSHRTVNKRPDAGPVSRDTHGPREH